MSNTFNIKQVQEMVGMTIPRIEAKVVAVYERKTGEGQYGPWSLQGGTVEDSTGKMKVTFKQLPDQTKLVGKTLIFKSMEGKHGLKGVEVKKNEYNGKTTLELHVSKVALIVGSEAEEANVNLVQPSTRMPQNEPERAVEPSKVNVEHSDRKLGLAMAKNRLTQLAGLYDLCWETVENMKAGDYFNMNGESRKDIATTLFIQASREGLADKLPVRTIEKFYGKEGVQDHPEQANQEEPADDSVPF